MENIFDQSVEEFNNRFYNRVANFFGFKLDIYHSILVIINSFTKIVYYHPIQARINILKLIKNNLRSSYVIL